MITTHNTSTAQGVIPVVTSDREAGVHSGYQLGRPLWTLGPWLNVQVIAGSIPQQEDPGWTGLGS